MLHRRLGLTQITAINMIDMVGIGPFITLPMVIGMMNGPYFLYAWLAGAALSFVDAMVWSELGAAFPKAGGSYNFLKEAYGPKGAGKMMSFLFVWQTMIQAPLVIASASIGFASYLAYLLPLDVWQSKAVSGGVVILIIVLLYRKIEAIGKISVFLWGGVSTYPFLDHRRRHSPWRFHEANSTNKRWTYNGLRLYYCHGVCMC
jgi:fructoselysine transporter